MITPEALRLAGRIEYPQFVLTPETRDAAAAELRRQHAEIERLNALAGPGGKSLAELEQINDDCIVEIERLIAERDALRADAEIGRQWREDSSLEKWFPLAAERLAALEAETAALKREAHTWLSQREVARRLGVQASTVNRWIKG